MTKPIVLIIEDNESNALMFSDTLDMVDYEPHIVNNGLDAINWLEMHEPPVLIMLDMNLPRYDGKQIYRHIRRHDRFASTRVIVATANSHMAEELQEELVDTDVVMLKPVDIRKLQTAAKQIHAAHKNNQENE